MQRVRILFLRRTSGAEDLEVASELGRAETAVAMAVAAQDPVVQAVAAVPFEAEKVAAALSAAEAMDQIEQIGQIQMLKTRQSQQRCYLHKKEKLIVQLYVG